MLLKGPGILLKDPRDLLNDPGVFSKDPGVLSKFQWTPWSFKRTPENRFEKFEPDCLQVPRLCAYALLLRVVVAWDGPLARRAAKPPGAF